MGNGSFMQRALGFGLGLVALIASPACMLHPGQVRDDQLAVEQARAANAERHVQALEARVTQLEAELARRSERDASARRAKDQTDAKLDRLIAAQEQLVLRFEQQQPPDTLTPAAPPPAATSGVDPALRAYLEHLIERAQSGAPPWRGGLSLEKQEALRILLDSQRHLELGNPMAL
jgi:hypothetical protein